MQDKNLLNQLSILNNLIRISEIDKFSESKSVVLVIGNTGAGKTSETLGVLAIHSCSRLVHQPGDIY